jgi:hypothetical protein
MRLLVGLTIQGAILFLVIGGLIYNVGGVRDWFGNGVSGAVIDQRQGALNARAPAQHGRSHG